MEPVNVRTGAHESRHDDADDSGTAGIAPPHLLHYTLQG